jgi:hypothetical protein
MSSGSIQSPMPLDESQIFGLLVAPAKRSQRANERTAHFARLGRTETN